MVAIARGRIWVAVRREGLGRLGRGDNALGAGGSLRLAILGLASTGKPAGLRSDDGVITSFVSTNLDERGTFGRQGDGAFMHIDRLIHLSA